MFRAAASPSLIMHSRCLWIVVRRPGKGFVSIGKDQRKLLDYGDAALAGLGGARERGQTLCDYVVVLSVFAADRSNGSLNSDQ